MNQTRMLHSKNCHSCPIFTATTHSRGTGITYSRLPSESKTSDRSVVRALLLRYRDLCDSAARSQRRSLSTCTCHAGMVHSHLHDMHLHIQSLTPVHMSKKQAMAKQACDCHRCCTLKSSAYRSSTHPTAKQPRILPTTDKVDFIYMHIHGTNTYRYEARISISIYMHTGASFPFTRMQMGTEEAQTSTPNIRNRHAPQHRLTFMSHIRSNNAFSGDRDYIL